MKYVRNYFGFDKLNLSETEKEEIHEQLRTVDENRLLFFSYIITGCLILMIFLDFIYFNDDNQLLYLLFDSFFLIVVFSFILISALNKKRLFGRLNRANQLMIDNLPLFFLFWATGICAIDPVSLLNIIAFYFILFILAFAVFTPFKNLLVYYGIIVVEYIVLCLLTGQPVMTENAFVMLLVCFLILPFYYSFRSNRYNAQAALLMLHKAKKNLETEVDLRTRELQVVNSNLKEEIGFRKLTESKLRDALKRADLNNQLKSEFIANISHEIRTPLNAIIGFTEMIIDENVLPDSKKEYQAQVEKNMESLLSVIDDIFNVSLVRTRQLVPVFSSITVNHFMRDLFREVDYVAIRYDKKRIDVVKKDFHPEDISFRTDAFFLRKAILRLVDNAFKFTSEGHIEIGAEINRDDLQFYVKDTGIGISPKDSRRIMEPFVQVDGSNTRDYGGSGLGLTIAKGISEALNCRLEFESEQGKGSRFAIVLPGNSIARSGKK